MLFLKWINFLRSILAKHAFRIYFGGKYFILKMVAIPRGPLQNWKLFLADWNAPYQISSKNQTSVLQLKLFKKKKGKSCLSVEFWVHKDIKQ